MDESHYHFMQTSAVRLFTEYVRRYLYSLEIPVHKYTSSQGCFVVIISVGREWVRADGAGER